MGFSGEFIGQAWLKGDHERALWLALAEPNPFDRSGEKAQKAISEGPLGSMERSQGSARAVIDAEHRDLPRRSSGRSPRSFCAARRELRSLYFSAFQSHLWNLLLSRWIESNTRPEQRVLVDLKVGNLAFPRDLEPEQRSRLEALPLPLPSARTPLPGEPLGHVIEQVSATISARMERSASSST